VLPYAAVAATDALLLVAAGYGHRPERLVIALGVVVVTTLVVARQIMTFRENRRLVERLDTRMEELRDHERRFRSLVQHSSDLITITGPDGVLTYVSPGITLLGRRVEDLLGQPAALLIHPDDVEVAVQHYRRTAAKPGATTTYQARVSHVDGSWRWMEITTSNLIHDPGIAGIVGNARDVTQARELQERLSHEASHDALTQLANRTLFAERVRTALGALGALEASAPGVILVDLNDFKTINDTLGHAVGDAMLVAVAQRLRQLAPPGATVARLGGDEFALLLPATTEGELIATADRLVRAFEPPVVVDDRELPVAASIGYAAGGDGVSPDELLRRADVAMYTAKADGERRRTRCAGYTTSTDRAFSALTDLERDLPIAIHRGDLHVVYQPIVDLADGRLVAVESLLRWTHPEHGPVPPLQFIPIAERTSLILPLGAQVLRVACEQAAAWHRRYGGLAPAVSVNLSPRQLREASLASEVAATLAGAGLAPHRLTVEVTESMPVEDPVSLANLDALHRLGVRISLDDFGTGQSALNLLDQCPVDELKLDRSFTQTCTDPNRRKVATAVIQLARTLGLDVVVEGVESSSQVEVLFELGYRHAQGYQFACPLEPSEVDARILTGVPAMGNVVRK
jgi:diguanylate cyclase (GGDEF)-like protein/PAS domain S-box-containing protein